MVILKDKVVVITGASSGIGKATAIAFARKGAKVVLSARRLDKLEQLKLYIQKSVQRSTKRCISVKTDVTDENDVKNLFDTTVKTFGAVDILINNAGRGLKSSIHDISTDEWRSVIDTNLTGVFLCTREAVRHMKIRCGKKRADKDCGVPDAGKCGRIIGHIITVSSIAGLYGAPDYAAYCASKHGVTGFKRSAKLELRRHGIKVSTVHPARVDTDFFDIYKKRPHRSQMLSPRDIADVILARASQNPSKIVWFRVLLVFKRIYCLIRYSISLGTRQDEQLTSR